MKNIWKLLMVAMMAIAMVGCPQTKDDDSDDSNSGSTSYIGVYSFDASVDSLSAAWGGSPAAPAFSIMLMDQIAIDSIADGTVTDLKEMPVGSPVYQIQGNGDNSFLTALDGSWKTKYDGVVATVANGRYTVFVDTAKVKKTQLKGIGKDFGEDGEELMTEADEVDLSKYMPVALALSDNTTDEPYKSAYIADLWSARLHRMKAGATYPNAQDTPAKVKFSIKFTGKVGSDDVEWTVKNVEYYTGAKAPYNFYNGSLSGATNEPAAANATLTATVSGDLASAAWEMANSGDNVWPNDFPSDAVYVKKALLGFEGRWIYFNALTGTYDLDGNSGSTDPVDAAIPTFTSNLSTETVTYSIASGNAAPVLTVVAAVTDDGTLSYKWQKKAEGDDDFADIADATAASYTPDVSAAGTTQYKVIVTNTNNDATGEKTATATSAIATVTVTE